VKPLPETPKVDFKWLKELLLSTDLERNSELDWIKDSGSRFLDTSVDMSEDGVCFGSFPRSGNSFLRRTIEDITGVVTGSHFAPKRADTLINAGLMGEGSTCEDNDVWVTKSHVSVFLAARIPYKAKKMILLVRNPIDVIPSLVSLISFMSHSLKPAKPVPELFPDRWNNHEIPF
jgi:hypothetical protein